MKKIQSNVTQDVNFEVIEIKELINQPGYVSILLYFYNNPAKEYFYRRKFYKASTVRNYVLIDGCVVEFYNCTKQVAEIKRFKDTAGVKKRKTSPSKKKNYIQQDEPVVDLLGEIEEEPIVAVPVVEEKPVWKSNGPVHHEKYDTILACIENDIPVYLAGPAGSGKNHTVEQIAKELDMNFYFTNSVQQEFKITGFVDAGGDYQPTEFYKACADEEECIFFLDEMDASIPEVLVLLNAAIANGYFEFPNGRLDFDHVHFVAAGNTVGSGADELYTGRLVLDQATLDRFAIIEFDYDRNIEMQITKGNVELVDFIRNLRNQAEQKGVRATFSYRCMTAVTKLEKNTKMTLIEILKISVFKGLDKDTINTFDIYSMNNSCKYKDAFYEMRKAA